MKEDRRTHAEESVAPMFSRMMRATVSPYGPLIDLPIISFATAATALIALGVGIKATGQVPVVALAVFAVLPILVGAVISLFLRGARAQVIAWLVTVPFPIENMNGLLNGVAEKLCVRFRETRPSREELMEALEAVHPDCFVMEFAGETDLDVEVKIGVLDSKYNPTRANYKRYRRVQQLVEQALVPLADKYPIKDVWVS